ncbi:hypothetical protein I6M49_16855 [Shewanella algae]|uniref:hypothetical protein n=1 Tax=Shewanella algae TaxID=38313 RepID=UPI001AADB91A|nr:hypothetical protein [Shewanella algae]MBO2655111.1 hypothetical protein [Shewanella algae]
MSNHSHNIASQPRTFTGLEEAVIAEEPLHCCTTSRLKRKPDVLLTAHLLADEQSHPDGCETQMKPSHVEWRLAAPKVYQNRTLSQHFVVSANEIIMLKHRIQSRGIN